VTFNVEHELLKKKKKGKWAYIQYNAKQNSWTEKTKTPRTAH